MFQPWNQAIRVLSRGWAVYPMPTGEVFEDITASPTMQPLPINYRLYTGAVMLVFLMLLVCAMVM